MEKDNHVFQNLKNFGLRYAVENFVWACDLKILKSLKNIEGLVEQPFITGVTNLW